jgi:hypothetical protein
VDEKWLAWRTRRRVAAAAVSVAAQDLYDQLVKQSLSPALRGLGFTGSGGRYSLRNEDCWALVGLQKSAYSDGHEVRFTVNLLVANKQAWDALRAEKTYLPRRPAPGTRYGYEVAQSRIGDLLPDRADAWWRIYNGVDINSVAQDVIASVERFGVPWLREQLAAQRCG